MGIDPFEGLPRGHFGAILADPPWYYEQRKDGGNRWVGNKYNLMGDAEICAMPIKELLADNAVLFLWSCWPKLEAALNVVRHWGFEYKTCAFDWMKAHANQIEMFRDDYDVQVGMGYWTRSNTEPCLLATKGQPKRLNADVRQGIIAPRREHSRKPDGIHERIERLVAGPYLELFARQQRPGWTVWGNQTDKFAPVKEAAE